MLTRQQVYDAAILWIYLQQGAKCVDAYYNCVYHRDNPNFAATRCVIGMYIHEDLRECDLNESTTLGELKLENKLPLCLRHLDMAFLQEIQNCHDRIIRSVTDTDDGVYKFFFLNDQNVRLTKQQFFDLCVVHLFAQNGEKCVLLSGSCAYRKSVPTSRLHAVSLGYSCLTTWPNNALRLVLLD